MHDVRRILVLDNKTQFIKHLKKEKEREREGKKANTYISFSKSNMFSIFYQFSPDHF
jgi:hypothetical protein